MKKYLCAVATLALGGAAQAGDFTCHLTDQRGNTLDYTFRTTSDSSNLELGFARNGQNATYSHTPIWHGVNNRDSSTIVSDEAPEWYITYATVNDNRAALWHNRNVVAQGACYNVPTVAAAPAYTAQAPDPAPAAPAPTTASAEDSIGLINVGKRVMVQVTLGSQPTVMVVDTGASVMLVPAKVAEQLVANGEADYGPDAEVTQANGANVSEQTIRVHSLTIGHHTISNVIGTVAPGDADAVGLLPFPVLNRVGRFTIDTQNNKLIFG
jgi:predicted aspartyl protease